MVISYSGNNLVRANQIRFCIKKLDRIFGIYWVHRIDLDRLNSNDPTDCILGQLTVKYGFSPDPYLRYTILSVWMTKFLGKDQDYWGIFAWTAYVPMWKTIINQLRIQRPM